MSKKYAFTLTGARSRVRVRGGPEEALHAGAQQLLHDPSAWCFLDTLHMAGWNLCSCSNLVHKL